VNEAIIHYQMALQIKPDYGEAHNNLGNALLQKGSAGEAIVQYEKALEIKPGYPEAQNNLAWVLATSSQVSLRNGGKAVELAERANQLTGGENPLILHTLAAAYAEAGRFGDAMRSVQKAIELAQAVGQKNLAGQLTGELKLYEAGLPFHQESK
jgi:Flp pilus assembly protein TadD